MLSGQLEPSGDLQLQVESGLNNPLSVASCVNPVVLWALNGHPAMTSQCIDAQAGIDAPPEEDPGLVTEELNDAELWLNNEQGEHIQPQPSGMTPSRWFMGHVGFVMGRALAACLVHACQ